MAVAAADVTVCIPTWQAADFIDRTLACARRQTHRRLRILVSVDRCDDDTLSICRAAAREDPRVEVLAQRERLGWSENANALLRAVDTELFFLYFHDDLIEPDYVARLRAALAEHPGAMSAHCDLEKFGKQSAVERGTDYRGAAARRLVAYLTEETKGPLLRGLMRSELVARGLCFPAIAGDGNWRVPPFAMRALAEGESIHVPELLYRRWMRDGSMTATWNPATPEQLVEGQRGCVERCLAIAGGIDATPAEQAVVRFCLGVRMLIRTRTSEWRLDRERLIDAAAVAPLCADLRLPDLSSFDPTLRAAVRASYAELLHVEARHALRRKDDATALPKLCAAAELSPHDAGLRADLARVRARRDARAAAAARP
jgi:hypothetical protein